ncbi:hypothetical protein AMELA_G00252240 [Ameiurus melas]|uniref:Regulator of G-protein signaling 3 n=1 Tax=Ameiurus melas TaxID=219545 RepID=A0A7J5ZSY3_AMEME|nr:hypothetical protein AMELA_G00252240 [Ameiurus melas]
MLNPSGCFSQVGLAPGSNAGTRRKTKTVPDCKSPLFQETFFFAVTKDEEKKNMRLLLTVWNCDGAIRQLVGCMSFGVCSLVRSEKISGWYYLLGQDLGRTKHLRVDPPGCTLNSESIEAAQANHAAAPDSTSPEIMQCLTVTIPRGKDGYGFTICSDSPIRVQAVDPGGPADLAGLRQLDTVLQLNGQSVEQWKCADLAHAIRSSAREITVVVWRSGPSVKSSYKGLIHQSYKSSNYDSPVSPPRTKRAEKTPPVPPLPAHLRHRILLNGSEGARGGGIGGTGVPWGDRREEGKASTRTHTPTLRGTRVKASNGDNYIILSPISPGGQILTQVYGDNPPGWMYPPGNANTPQTHAAPSLASRTNFLRRSGNKSKSTATSYQPSSNFANYQNCTIVRSHANYGAYIKVAPKVLIFPIFVQPLDLCSPTRTLLITEEMILHESKHLSIKDVSVPPHYALRRRAESEGVEDDVVDVEVRFKVGLLVFLALAPLTEL